MTTSVLSRVSQYLNATALIFLPVLHSQFPEEVECLVGAGVVLPRQEHQQRVAGPGEEALAKPKAWRYRVTILVGGNLPLT